MRNQMSGNKRVFISYSSQDQKTATQLVEYLEKKSVSCFIASRDIVSGKTYPEEIVKAINNCDTVIVMLTEQSNNSDNVRNEIERAFNLKKTLILFRIENIALSSSLEYFFASFHWLEATEGSPAMYFERLYCAINELPQPPLPKKYVIIKKATNLSLRAYLLLSLLGFSIWGLPLIETSKENEQLKKKYEPVSKIDPNGLTLLDDIIRSGLTSLDDRATHPSPPKYLYQNAKKDILIAGITNKFTLQNCKMALDSAMGRGVKIRMLFLNPNSRDTDIVKTINKRGESFYVEFLGLREILKNDSSFMNNPNLEIRFFDNLPPFVGVMIDAGIDSVDNKINTGAIVRVAPYLKSPIHNDWIFQFMNAGATKNAFNDFANEFGYMWHVLSKPHPEYFR